MGVILGLRLTRNVIQVLEITMQMVLFRSRGRDFGPFVANHVGQIQMATEPWQSGNASMYPLIKVRQIYAREDQAHSH